MAYVLGKDLDNWVDSVSTREPYAASSDENIGAQYMTGTDLLRSVKISPEWKQPLAVYAQSYNPLYISGQMSRSFWDSLADYINELPYNMENLAAQNALETLQGESKTPDFLKLANSEFQTLAKGIQNIAALGIIIPGLKETSAEIKEKAQTYDELVDLLQNQEYPLEKYAKRVIADNTNHVENRRIVRELYKQSQGIDSKAWYNQMASILGAMTPAIVAGSLGHTGALIGGASRANAINTARGIAQGLIGMQAAGEYAEETASEYLRRTGDRNFENFTAKDATGLGAIAYGAINSQIEFLGGVEPIMAGALNKVGLRAGGIKAALKIGAGEATEEFLQGITELLMRKMDGTTDKTWGDGILEALNGAVWGMFIGGVTGTPAFYMNRRNLVNGIRKAFPQLDSATATQVADAMIDTVGEVSSQDQTLRNNLRKKIEFMYSKIDLDNKEDRIDAMTDLEYTLAVMDASDRGIDLKDHELFQGEVTPIGWFRAGIPENIRADVKTVIDNITELETQLEELNKAKEKDWAKIEEIENKLAQQDEWVRNKLSDIISKESFARELNKLESKYVAKQKKKAGIPVDAIFESLPDKNFNTTQKYTADKPYKYTSNNNNFQYYDDGIHHIVQLLDKDGKILSSIEISKQAKDVSYIQTEPEYKRKGFGTILLKESERLFGNKMKAKPSPTVEAVEFWKKNGYTRDMGDGMVTKETEPTIAEEKEAVKQAADVADGTITTGTPEPVAENVIQDYGEKIEGAKKDIVGKGVSSETLTDIDKIMKKAPKSETSKQILRNWLEQQDPEFVAQIRQLNLPIRVSKTLEYRRVLAEAFTQHPELNLEADRYDVLAGTEELSQETLDKYSIVPEYDFYYKTTDDNYVKLTPENVAARIEGRGALQFSYSKSTRGVYFLWAKKGSGSWIPLIEFGSMEEMDEHRNNHTQEDREKIYQEMTSFKDNRKEKVIRERVGTDYRNGKNVTEEQFAKQFGFRGVQFGNYENQEKRQKEINNSYDSFMDLANILGLPPKAISLGGTLGIAFGARGSGSALAHYEPDLKVINITRDAGAGALAHEWFHALDNYLAQNLSEYANMASGGWITKSDNYYYYKVNEELSNSLKEYIRSIKNEKAFQLRLRQLGQYWKRDWEVAARLFEQYVSAKVAEQNGINDYLANPQKYYISSSPYLTLEESQRVFPKLENMLNSIKTREDENQNIVLYQTRISGKGKDDYRGAYIPQLRFIQRTNKMDASTLSHELAHDWFETNFYRYRDGKMSKDFMKAWGALEKALGITEKDKVPPRQASETFARAYEAWLTSNENWNKLIAVDDKDKDAVAKLMQDYQNALRDIYNDISNPYFKQTWGKLGELKPELKAWFDRMVDVKDLDVLVERGEMTPEQASQEKLNQAIDKVIENTKDAETAQTLKEVRTLNDTKRYEAEGGNKNSIQMRLSALAREIDENNMAVKGESYDTHRDMMAVAEAADSFVKTRLDDALAIINGQMAEVEGLFKEDLYTALERLAIENGDMGLIDELRNSEVANRLAKELGQRVAGFRNWKSTTEVDVLSAVKSLDNKFNEALKNKKAQKQFNEALDMLDKELKAQDKLADKELDATLKELECK